MKEITRIHIAKVPYDIEISAKKEIENYINALEKYADDVELLQDIEIRITEILAELGVKANSVIASEDVKAIRKQLGEPKEFMSENESDKIYEIEKNIEVKRKLYRNVDGAMLGGVLSGLAGFFSVSTVWVRLGFVFLLMVSAGTASLLYLVLWIIMPPARTATERLYMTGRPVTLNSIKELNESEPELVNKYERAGVIRRIVSVFFGSIFLIISISIAMATIIGAIGFNHFNAWSSLPSSSGWEFLAAFSLAVLAGLLLSLLFAVFSYSAFVRNFTKRIGISIAVIIAAGLISFGTAVGLVAYQASDRIQNGMTESVVAVPDNFSNIKTLNVDTKNFSVDYIVDAGISNITVQSFTGLSQPTITVDGLSASIIFEQENNSKWFYAPSILTVRGPKLDSIIVKSGNVSYTTNEQDLTIKSSGQQSNIDLKHGTFKKLTINANESSTVDATSSSVETAIVNQSNDSKILLGTIRDLTVTQPLSCPAYDETRLEIESVTSEDMVYNDKLAKTVTYISNCGSVLINE